jgi:hypothetical protein
VNQFVIDELLLVIEHPAVAQARFTDERRPHRADRQTDQIREIKIGSRGNRTTRGAPLERRGLRHVSLAGGVTPNDLYRKNSSSGEPAIVIVRQTAG